MRKYNETNLTLEDLLAKGINAVIDPAVLFEDLEEVKLFLEIECTKEDLVATLARFEKCEWFEACRLIQNKIDQYE